MTLQALRPRSVISAELGQSGLPTRAQPKSEASALRLTARSGPTTLPFASSRYIFSVTSYSTASTPGTSSTTPRFRLRRGSADAGLVAASTPHASATKDHAMARFHLLP